MNSSLTSGELSIIKPANNIYSYDLTNSLATERDDESLMNKM